MEIIRKLFINYLNVFKRFYDYKSRAGRFEFWGFFAINALILRGLIILSTWQEAFSYLLSAYAIALLVAFMALLARRLHDTGKSALWVIGVFIGLISMSPYIQMQPWYISGILSFVGSISILFAMISAFFPSDKENKYGPKPEETKQDTITAYVCMAIYILLLAYTFYYIYSLINAVENAYTYGIRPEAAHIVAPQ